MKVAQKIWSPQKGWEDILPKNFQETPQIVFLFGARIFLEDESFFQRIRSEFTDSTLVLCSTAGEIAGQHVYDNSVVLTAIYFEKTNIQFAESEISSAAESQSVGQALAQKLSQQGLVHVMVFSEGLHINGTDLVHGLNSQLPPGVTVTGGLVADGADFKKTVVGINKTAKERKIVVIGFYGDSLKVGYGSFGGWDTFGIERVITKSHDNIVYTLDDKPALELYKTYLGDKAKDLPASGLLFPLLLKRDDLPNYPVTRTLLAVNEAEQSLTFAGDMPEGARVSLMKANFERLIDGAAQAGSQSLVSLSGKSAELAILISCVGRKLVLKERVENELNAVAEILGTKTVLTGFYSYGELCPTAATEKQCELHNQTMTITTFSEA